MLNDLANALRRWYGSSIENVPPNGAGRCRMMEEMGAGVEETKTEEAA